MAGKKSHRDPLSVLFRSGVKEEDIDSKPGSNTFNRMDSAKLIWLHMVVVLNWNREMILGVKYSEIYHTIFSNILLVFR